MRYLLTALFIVAAVAQAQAQATVATLCNSGGSWVACPSEPTVTVTDGAGALNTIVDSGAVQPVAGATGGADAFSHLSVGLTEDKHAVKATAGTLYSIAATNTNAAVRYLKCENDTAANTAPGIDTPELRIAIPAAGAGLSLTFPVGYSFSTALTCWLVTGAADADAIEVAAAEIMVFYTFK